MKKWDYITLIADSYLRVEEKNGEKVKQIEEEYQGLLGKGKDKRYPHLFNILQELGKQGWEVCGMSPNRTALEGRIDSVCVILKRPLEEN